MSSRMSAVRDEIGLKCLTCGQMQLPPNRAVLDNWSCGKCSSGFISVVMLTNLVPRDFIAQINHRPDRPGYGRGCPKCRHTMEIAHAQYRDKHAELEICRACHVLWFDSGELTRVLRYQEEFISDEEIYQQVIRKGINRRKEAAATAPVPLVEAAVPWATVSIFLLCAALVPLAMRFPDVKARFGFLPAAPFRELGLTWITSLFLNDSTQMHGMLLFLCFGIYLERKLGIVRFLNLFFASGMIGRMIYLLSGGSDAALTIGATAAVAGVVAYSLLTVPYKDFLFPEDRWRSPASGMAWAMMAVVAIVGIYLCWDFFHIAFSNVTYGAPGGISGTVLGNLSKMFASPDFKAHFASTVLGLMFFAGEAAAPPLPQPRRKHAK